MDGTHHPRTRRIANGSESLLACARRSWRDPAARLNRQGINTANPQGELQTHDGNKAQYIKTTWRQKIHEVPVPPDRDSGRRRLIRSAKFRTMLCTMSPRPSPKNEKMATERILTQHRLDLRGKAVDAAAQVGPARCQVNTHAIRQPDYERLSTTSISRFKVTASKPRPTRRMLPPSEPVRSGPPAAPAHSPPVRRLGPTETSPRPLVRPMISGRRRPAL
jgi:hypothetical protein